MTQSDTVSLLFFKINLFIIGGRPRVTVRHCVIERPFGDKGTWGRRNQLQDDGLLSGNGFFPRFDTNNFLNKEILKAPHHTTTHQPKRNFNSCFLEAPRDKTMRASTHCLFYEGAFTVDGVDMVDGFKSLSFSSNNSLFFLNAQNMSTLSIPSTKHQNSTAFFTRRKPLLGRSRVEVAGLTGLNPFLFYKSISSSKSSKYVNPVNCVNQNFKFNCAFKVTETGGKASFTREKPFLGFRGGSHLFAVDELMGLTGLNPIN